LKEIVEKGGTGFAFVIVFGEFGRKNDENNFGSEKEHAPMMLARIIPKATMTRRKCVSLNIQCYQSDIWRALKVIVGV
jgi:hypothetical protein